MKKEFVIALLALGFIFAGAMSASAGSATWTLVQTLGMKLHGPGADGVIGTGDDDTDAKCNYSPAEGCAAAGNPTEGAYSYTKLNFKMDASCVVGTGGALAGDECTENADCGGALTVCAPCNPPSLEGITYFARNPDGGSKGAGTYTVNACEDGFEFTDAAIGTSEVVPASGGSCLVFDAHNSSTGCGEGSTSTNYDMVLWTSTIGKCGFNAGKMPGLPLAGRIYAAPTASTAICGYTTGQIEAIMTDAGVTSGYLMVTCGTGTLPTDVQTACLRGADWEAVIVAKTTADLSAECASACSSGGCMAGTAEGVE